MAGAGAVTAAFDCREISASDQDAVLALIERAFPEEPLTDLVRALLKEDAVLSLGAQAEDALIGYAAFTRCAVAGQTEPVALLGPIGIAPERQRSGAGAALIEAGAARLKAEGCAELLVLGDPAYYRRRGFKDAAAVEPPYPLPEVWAEMGAWRTRPLTGRPPLSGPLQAPAPWRDPALWA